MLWALSWAEARMLTECHRDPGTDHGPSPPFSGFSARNRTEEKLLKRAHAIASQDFAARIRFT